MKAILLKSIFFVSFVLLCISSFSQTSWKGTTSTAWGTSSNWTNGVPTASLDVIIGDANFTGANQPTISTTSTCKSLTIGGAVAATITISQTTTVSGLITINSNGAITQGNCILSVGGDWINGGTYTTTNNSAKVTFNGLTQALGGTAVTTFKKLTINAGSTVTLGSNVTVTGGAGAFTVGGIVNPNESPTYLMTISNLTLSNNATLKVNASTFAGNYAVSGTTTISAGSTINYSSATVNQTVSNSYTYSTLTISGTGTKTLGGNLTNLTSSNAAYGNINVTSGILDLSTFTANRGTTTVGGTLTVSNGASLKIGGTNTFPANYSTVSLTLTGTVEYYGTAQTVSAQTYGNLTLSSSSGAVLKTMPGTAFTVEGTLTSSIGSGTSVSYTAASNIAVNGDLVIGASTTFNGGSYTHTITGNWTNNGTFTGTTSTLIMNQANCAFTGTGTNNFYNLTISASGITASASAYLTVAGNFSTSGSGTFSHSSGGTLAMTGASKTISGTGIILDNLLVSGTITTTSSITITGNLTASGSLTWSSGTATFTGSSKTFGGTGSIAFSALYISGSITSSDNISISSSMDISGTFTASAGTTTFTGNSTINGTANLYNVTLNCTSLQLSTNTILGIANAYAVTAGTLDVTSTTPNTVNYNGTGAQTIFSGTYDQLQLTNGNTKTAGGGIYVKGDITIGSSTTFAASSYTDSIYGNWVNNGTFTAGTSTIHLIGSSNTTISGTNTFKVLTINKSSSTNTVSLSNNISVPTLNMTQGTLLTGSNTVTITTTRTGNGIILGNITRTHSFITGTAYAFEGPYNTITFSSVSGVTSITEVVTLGTISDYPSAASINRLYNITIVSGTYNATLRLHYEDLELNGNVESTLQLWQYDGAAWASSGVTGNSTTNNYVELSGLTDVTNRWTLSYPQNIIQWNGSVSTLWNTAANWTNVEGSPSFPPGVNDNVQIGSTTATYDPTISSAVSIKSIEFGSVQASTLTIASGGSLTTSGNINGDWSAGSAHTLAIGAQTLAVGGDLTLSDGTSGHSIDLTIGSGTATVAGSLTESGGANITVTGAGALNVGGDFNYTNGTFTPGSGTTTYNGTGSQSIGSVTYNYLNINKASGIALINNSATVNADLSITSGELDINSVSTIAGNVTISSGAFLTSGSVIKYVGGNWTNNGTFTSANGEINLNGSGAQSISSTTFNNLTINKSAGTATLTGNIIINGNLSITGGTLDLASYTANRSSSGGAFTLSNGANLLVGGSTNMPNNYSTYTLGNSSSVTYNGTGTQTIKGLTYGNITFSNGSTNVKTLWASTTVNGNLTINSGATFDASSYSITLYGNFANAGTFTASTSTLILNGTSKTITGNSTINNVIVNGSYSSAGSNMTYNGLVFIATGGSYACGGGTATINGDLTNSGSISSSGTSTFTGTRVQTLRLINAMTSTSTGVVNFNGTYAPVLNSTASSPTFATLNINNTAGVTPFVGWKVLIALNIGSGSALYLGSGAHTVSGSFTNNGTVTSTGSILFNAPTPVTISLGTSFTSTGRVTFGGSGAITVTGTPILTDVVISNKNAAGITPPSGWTIANDFSISDSAIFNAGSYSYSVGGDFTCDGTLNGGTSTFTLNSTTSGQLSGSPTTTFYNLVIGDTTIVNSDFNVTNNFTNNGIYNGSSGSLTMTGSGASGIGGSSGTPSLGQLIIAKTGNATVTLTANIIDVALLYVQSGTLFTSTYGITQDVGGGVLLVDAGASLKLGGTNTLPAFSANSLDPSSNVEYAGTTQSIGNAVTYGNLIISSSGTKSAPASFTTAGNFTLSAGTFTSVSTVTHYIGGNWIMSGGTFNTTNITIAFNSTGNQSISSTGDFKDLILNKTSGNFTLASNATVTGTLTFTSGKLDIGNYNLTMGPSSTLTGASASSYIIASGTGAMKQLIANSGTKTFPVGTLSDYLPANIALTSGSTTDTFGLRVLNEVRYDGSSGTLMTTGIVNATWYITEGTAGGSNATVTLQWPLADELSGFTRSACRLGHYTGGTWDYGTGDLTASGSNPYTLSRANITSFSPFSVGNMGTLPVTLINLSGENMGNQNIIYWSTATEINNDYFTIEKTKDGATFETVNIVDGAGNSKNIKKYSTIDKSPYTGTTWYRLIQTDYNGKVTYSHLVPVESNKTVNLIVEIFPNPNTGGVTSITVNANKDEPVVMHVYDYAGKEVYMNSTRAQANNTNVNFIIPSQQLSEGVYVVNIISGTSTQNQRLIIK